MEIDHVPAEEVLFVDYIMEHLKPTGRAGIVVPEGIIFSFPVTITDGKATVVQGIEHNEYARSKIAATARELVTEREAVADLLA